MIVRLWALAWAARYLKYVPILGWRFSDPIAREIEARMDREVDVSEVTVDFEDGQPPTDLRIVMTVTNELPVDLTVAALNLRIGYEAEAGTVANLLWAADAHGDPPANVSRSLVESNETEELTVERYVSADTPGDTVTVDGTVTTRAWLDLPQTKRVPLGTLRRDVDRTTVALPN